jgi:tRNA pseudouridine(55) synthase
MKIHPLITTTPALADLCERLSKADFITVDTEFMRENTYWPELCLVQIADDKEAAAIDPLASGILPIAMGEATKTVPFVMDGRKAYRFTVTWGAETTTDDAEGEIVERSDSRPSAAQIMAALGAFVGEIDQTPPAYSAIKIDGKRAYALARAGEAVVMKSRKVLIHKLDFLGASDADTARFRLACGKGTYVRSLARDLAKAFNIQKGEIPGRPEYGTLLWSYVFENQATDTTQDMLAEIQRVAGGDPRVSIQDAQIYPQENGILIELFVRTVNSSEAQLLSLFLDQESRRATFI